MYRVFVKFWITCQGCISFRDYYYRTNPQKWMTITGTRLHHQYPSMDTPAFLSFLKTTTHPRTHPPTQAHTHISFMSKHLLPHSKNRQNGKPHRVYVTQTTADLSFKHVGCCSCVVHFGLSQAKTSQGACHTSHCRPTHQTCWVLFMCCSFWSGLKLPRTLNQWLLMNSNWGHYMQFIFIVPSYSNSKTNTPVLKYTVIMSMVVMTVKPIPLYQNVQSQHLWL